MRGRRKRGNYFRVAHTVYWKSASTGPGAHRGRNEPLYRRYALSDSRLSFPDREPNSEHGGGYEMETLALDVPFMAACLDPGDWRRPLASAMESCAQMAGLWIVAEDMTQEQNAMKLHDQLKDRYDMPIPDVWFTDHANDAAILFSPSL